IGLRMTGAVSEMSIAPVDAPDELLGAGIDQELAVIESKPAFRLVGSVHAITIQLTGNDVAHVAVPDVFRPLGQHDALELAPALAVEETHSNLCGRGGEQSKVSPATAPGRAQRRRRAGRQPFLRVPEREKLLPTAG